MIILLCCMSKMNEKKSSNGLGLVVKQNKKLTDRLGDYEDDVQFQNLDNRAPREIWRRLVKFPG